MKALQETTKWDCEVNIPNHIYFLEKDRCVGYIKAGTGERIMFKKPMRFDKRYRTFKELKDFG